MARVKQDDANRRPRRVSKRRAVAVFAFIVLVLLAYAFWGDNLPWSDGGAGVVGATIAGARGLGERAAGVLPASPRC
ncbi:hypothetical protein ER308_01105 [Egibacter rhizosphaerae]|uniref:Uncharacterized protein n=1 Tax=Egibacter rhizosphaerae TaxID=1670831 RepID=A0A411YAT2_9ACTN|nr:hypothetical protein [Egibacter rhizosphaerae]QBI18305.1 hypothetical protein ER308_01105 [Egibacter rhizosphaerae]